MKAVPARTKLLTFRQAEDYCDYLEREQIPFRVRVECGLLAVEAPVAQVAEHRTFNARVPSSSLGGSIGY